MSELLGRLLAERGAGCARLGWRAAGCVASTLLRLCVWCRVLCVVCRWFGGVVGVCRSCCLGVGGGGSPLCSLCICWGGVVASGGALGVAWGVVADGEGERLYRGGGLALRRGYPGEPDIQATATVGLVDAIDAHCLGVSVVEVGGDLGECCDYLRFDSSPVAGRRPD